MPEYKLDLNFSLGSLLGFLFRAKRCPSCGAKLERHLIKEPIEPDRPQEQPHEGTGINVRVRYNTVRVVLVFRCEQCCMTYTPAQLIQGLPGVPTSETADAEVLGRSAEQASQEEENVPIEPR